MASRLGSFLYSIPAFMLLLSKLMKIIPCTQSQIIEFQRFADIALLELGLAKINSLLATQTVKASAEEN
jgi:hypothetical protein